jgi:hypothetical protein
MRFYLLLTFALFIASCGKKKSDPDKTTTAPINCSLQISTLVINDSVNFISSDSSYTTSNNTYYIQHQVTSIKGASFDFGGIEKPAAGTYEITPNYTEILPGVKKVYVQYFNNGESYQGQSGNVLISANGAENIIEFCKIDFKNSFNQGYTVSFKGILH